MPMRKRLRLRRYDYAAAGAYFVTVCVFGKECVLGAVIRDTVVLSRVGRVVAAELPRAVSRRGAELDRAVVMPNHVHALIWLPGKAHSLGAIVGAFKASSAREINILRGTPGEPFWQRGFFDHVVRDEADLERVREYIATNALRWSLGNQVP
jgi:putative transposase